MKQGRLEEGYDERKNNGVTFAYGIFSLDHCFGHHAHVCLCAFCCSPLRLADTYSKKPMPLVKNFWTALIMVTVLIALDVLSYGVTGCLLLGVAIYFRQKMRQKYGLEHGAAGHVQWLRRPVRSSLSSHLQAWESRVCHPTSK